MPKIPQTLALATVLTAAVASVSLGFTDWEQETPGTKHFIRPDDIAPPTGPSTVNIPSVVPRPAGVVPQVPAGFKAELFASGLDGPRTIRVAPNGDIFVVESRAGRIHVFRTGENNDAPVTESIFAANLNLPSGVAFAPPGPNPQYVYVADTDAVLRFPYHNGDLQAAGPAEVVIPSLPVGGHWTRDIAFSPQGDRLFIAIGSRSNDAEDLSPRSPEEIRAFEATHGLGATWDDEEGRALVAVYDMQEGSLKPFATGLRNCISLAIHPQAKDLWCTNDERDEFGDNAMPDVVTRIQQGAFYGWPFTYLGGREDPRHKNQRPELAERTAMPDVLLQPHSAPLAITFYDADQFPPEYRGDAFVALHGSYNRSRRTGYKVVRLFLKNGVPTGEYEDFMTGFVVSDEAVWGRPAGVAVTRNGALLVSEDAGGTVWRVSRAPLKEAAQH